MKARLRCSRRSLFFPYNNIGLTRIARLPVLSELMSSPQGFLVQGMANRKQILRRPIERLHDMRYAIIAQLAEGSARS